MNDLVKPDYEIMIFQTRGFLLSSEKAELVANCDQLTALKNSTINLPVFIEQGVKKLSSLLHSEKAFKIHMNPKNTAL